MGAVVMQTSARSLDQVYESLANALGELDTHGQAMAALHLAMAVDCLRDSLENRTGDMGWELANRPQLRLVASS
ncbi:MAG: hypothetical protein B7Y89_05255 [Novosphingobium sp. 32-60-15]|nr:MAG: hypothetical protein B7Y89_05255 [Novosphingobium sp. 32-60-15]